MINNYRYFITDPVNGRTEYFPLGESSLQLVEEQTDPLVFTRSKKFNGKLVFVKDDYERLKALESDPIENYECVQLLLEIEENQNGVWIVVSAGNFKLLTGKWDEYKCRVEITPSFVTAEDRIKNSVEVNLFDLVDAASRIKVSTKNIFEDIPDSVGFQIQRYNGQTIQEGTPISAPTPPGPGYVLEFQENITYVGPYQYQYRDFFNDWIQVCDRQYNGKPTQYIQNYIFIRYFKWIPIADPLPDGTIEGGETSGSDRLVVKEPSMGEWQETGPSQWKDICGSHTTKNRNALDLPNSPQNPADENIIDNGVTLKDALSFLVSPLGFSVYSRFFNINSLFSIDEQTNYVTAQRSTTSRIVLFQKSDVKRWNNSPENNATVFKMTAKLLLESLCKMFNCRWGVENGTLIIEHVSYFRSNSTLLDLTQEPYLKYVKEKKAYSYISDTYPYRETFTFMEPSQEVQGWSDFNGLPITYKNECTTGENASKEENTAVDKVTNDIGALMEAGTQEVVTGQQSGEFSNDGFVMASCVYVPEGETVFDNDGVTEITVYYFVITKALLIDFTSRINNVFGWAHLHKDFWKHDRYFSQGYMNNELQTFNTTKPDKESDTLSFVYCLPIQEFSANTIVKTPAGFGTIKSSSFNFSTKRMELKISFLKMSAVPWDGKIYGRMIIIPQDPEVTIGECEDQPGVPFLFIRSEWVTLRAEFFKDQYGIEPYYREPDAIPGIVAERDTTLGDGSHLYTYYDLEPEIGSNVFIQENVQIYYEAHSCEGTGFKETSTLRAAGTSWGVIII